MLSTLLHYVLQYRLLGWFLLDGYGYGYGLATKVAAFTRRIVGLLLLGFLWLLFLLLLLLLLFPLTLLLLLLQLRPFSTRSEILSLAIVIVIDIIVDIDIVIAIVIAGGGAPFYRRFGRLLYALLVKAKAVSTRRIAGLLFSLPIYIISLLLLLFWLMLPFTVTAPPTGGERFARFVLAFVAIYVATTCSPYR